ncbi:MAG: Flp pilus assembly complex ATPase component TadA [Lachnospiraceae bacterium]|nr:Flp pilus assembly complex ATPase component TadA [Lachnospiraceae bacterium]
MAYKADERISRILLGNGVLTEEQCAEISARCEESGRTENSVILESGYATEIQVAEAISQKMDLPLISLPDQEIPEELLQMVDPALLKKYVVLPVEFSEKKKRTICLAMADPMNFLVIDDISAITGYRVEAVVATPQDILTTIDRYFGAEQAQDMAKLYAEERGELFQEIQEDQENDEVNNSPIVVLVNTMIEQAARQRASDIHIEALSNCVRVRFRIDGVLCERMVYSTDLLPAIVARIKIIGGMDISEKRKPQDGRIAVTVDRREYDIRASVLPTVYGEKCVLRLSLKKGILRSLEKLGLSEEERQKFDRILFRPHGIVLVTGPTGSGKTTTLYAALTALNRPEVNVLTIEDPVEANVDGINQLQVNPKAGLTFASALRSILRQDPDIIMVGEIRDDETASAAIQASITGHLVLSTLHTNSTANTITRLLDMGVESYLIADALTGVVAQRLLRRLCSYCKEEYEATEEEKIGLGVSPEESLRLFRPCGCRRCNNTGYHERIGVYEIMEITPEMKRLITRHGTTDEINDLAMKEGMNTLMQSAGRLVKEGITAYSEMMRLAMEE